MNICPFAIFTMVVGICTAQPCKDCRPLHALWPKPTFVETILDSPSYPYLLSVFDINVHAATIAAIGRIRHYYRAFYTLGF